MGSKGIKPRKPQHHLAKVGTPANEAYERAERKKYLGGTWMWIVLVGLALVMFAWVVLVAIF
jgi:hypothetical protein